MNIFADWHHGGAARGQAMLLDRLGHSVCFPDADMVEKTLQWCRPGLHRDQKPL